MTPSPAAPSAGHVASLNRLYVVLTYVPRRTEITVGALGTFRFERGWYAYLGSARRARGARVARHLRAAKRLRWHADYLLARFPGRCAWLLDTRLDECGLADALQRDVGARREPDGFGTGDCGCAGHLLCVPRGQELGAALRALGGRRYRRPPSARPRA